jgi:hypothetical protein
MIMFYMSCLIPHHHGGGGPQAWRRHHHPHHHPPPRTKGFGWDPATRGGRPSEDGTRIGTLLSESLNVVCVGDVLVICS